MLVEPLLALLMTASPNPVTAGDKVRYTITVRNTSETVVDKVDVVGDLSGVLDDATYNGDSAPAAVTVSGKRLTWHGDVTAGATVKITFSVTTLVASEDDNTLIGSVHAGDSNCPPDSAAKACLTVVEINPKPTKSAVAPWPSTLEPVARRSPEPLVTLPPPETLPPPVEIQADGLATTGRPLIIWTGLAAMLIAAGAVVLLIRRRGW